MRLSFSELLNTQFLHDHSLDLIDQSLQVFITGNPSSINRREHYHFNRSRPGFAGAPTHQLIAVLESNRNDRHADLHGHVKCTLLEWQHFAGLSAGPFSTYAERNS